MLITENTITEEIKNLARELEQETIDCRGYLHERPELSGKEYETSRYLKDEVRKIGLEIEEVPGSTGFTALLDTGRPGKTLGIRTDIDALPVFETPNNISGERKYVSQNPGVMHACGHDGHMAIVLGAMKILLGLKNQLNGKIYFIFEEGEEVWSGIYQMLDHLEDKNIDAIYGTHVTSFMETGKVCVDSGPRMAGAAKVTFTVRGKGGHGSRPDLSINPVFAAANVLTGLTSAWANQIDVSKTVTLGITQIHGGSLGNVIPDKVDINGSLRFFDMEEGERAVGVMKSVIEHTAKAHNCSVEFDEEFDVAAPPVINDEKLSAIAQLGIKEILPESLQTDVVWYASESFSQYEKLAPTCFAFVGIGNKEYGSGAEHHNEYFDLDDDALYYGVVATSKFAVDYLLQSI